MKYLLAIVLPPVALFVVGKPLHGILNLLLMMTVLGWPVAALWAVLVVHSVEADRRNRELIAALERSRR